MRDVTRLCRWSLWGRRDQETVAFEVDTGFSGSLMLPPDLVAALELPQAEEIRIRLADGSFNRCLVLSGGCPLGRCCSPGRVAASGSQPLLGMSIAVGYNISINMVDGGRVALTRLSPDAVP